VAVRRRRRARIPKINRHLLDWYDFIIFGYLTVVISRLLFPAESQYTTATFGVGFFMRPVAGILADRKGRKAALQLIIEACYANIWARGFAIILVLACVAAPRLTSSLFAIAVQPSMGPGGRCSLWVLAV
jgi:MFS transporter, MHS family, proline/betaine transporter